MILDHENILSEDQEITGDAASTNIIDLGAVAESDIGGAAPAYHKKGGRLVVSVSEDFVTLTDLIIKLRTFAAYSGTVSNATPTSPVTVYEKTVLLADLIVGKPLIDMELPLGLSQYIDLYYDVEGSNPGSKSKLNAMIVYDSQSNGY